jgi:hypothetical protein
MVGSGRRCARADGRIAEAIKCPSQDMLFLVSPKNQQNFLEKDHLSIDLPRLGRRNILKERICMKAGMILVPDE